ncbi:MAG: inosine 5-monophosphate dehydrogenase [Candidatus Portnoybacteria bacterium CG11_big_fil_rev_8_21_14_0_20_44_10]|uniref:Inosine 5-monophosphate dehydrogenase n=1 Tax=Candidatus Portnoybacteria bacterium CG11_big_fil_rev_8_21_14_0_20_44_10 TaxID=1974818 RepID=A0A2H0KRP5_9BACT|nr:MAG: inosine 5-monophosphate dehydrogenase [Candidatus Portnoybacteria bacterium CG11_big_fil_rev_8_21_14_0_20_44_10]
MARIINEPSRTFGEYLFDPNQKEGHYRPENVNLRTPLVKHRKREDPSLFLNIPLVSACMQAVSGPELASALARCGGLSFIFQSQSIEDQVAMIRRVKGSKAGFVISTSNLRPENTITDVLELHEKTGHSTIPITHDGTGAGYLLGILTEHDWKFEENRGRPVSEVMTKIEDVIFGPAGISLHEANSLLKKYKKSCLPIIDNEGNLQSLVFWKDLMSHLDNPDELLDVEKRLVVGAGINTWDYQDRVPALIAAGADVLCVDSANGFTDHQKDVIRWIKREFGNSVKVGGGNVVSARGFKFLAGAGADFIKVGIGGGSICITREQKGIGKGQATALMEVVEARDEIFHRTGIYIPVCSDGAIVYPVHVAMALALGADFVMMGGWFARFREAPGRLIMDGGNYYKEYWGEATNKARNFSRYDVAPDKKGLFVFEEGVEGRVPFAGDLKDGVRDALAKIRATMCDCGALDIREFREEAVIQLASPLAIAEGGANVIVNKNIFSGK